MVSWFRQFCVRVSDLDATIKFYGVLGLECTSRTVITDDITEAVLENPERGGWLQLAHWKSVPKIDMGTAMWKLYVNTDDCRGLHARALDAGYTEQMAPMEPERWPVTISFLNDPDGYLIELLQRDEKPTGRTAGGSPRDQSV